HNPDLKLILAGLSPILLGFHPANLTESLKTDYFIEGNLPGPIIALQKITRKSVKIPLNFDGTKLTGRLHTSGKAAGRAGQMKLSASNLTRTRPEKPLP
ncbi:MAG: hypothetical protein GWQ08_25955, partial [Verrucomicrobiaceae bacterium]|nr:hypothetical protein [Verrucomicrobiaceae bacterium]